MPENTNDPVARIDAALAADKVERAAELKKLQDAQAELKVEFERLNKRFVTPNGDPIPKLRLAPVVRALMTGRWDGYENVRDEWTQRTDLSVATAGTAGYVVPAVYSNQMIDNLTATTQLRQMGVNTIMGVRGKTISLARKTAGTSAAYLAENTALSATNPVFEQVQVSPHLAGAYTAMSRLLAENADPAMEGIVRNDLSRAAGLLMDLTGLYGSGSGSNPTGLYNDGSANVTSKAAAITLDHCLDMITAVESRNGIVDQSKCAFRMHPALWGALRKKRAGGSTTTDGPYLLSNDPSSPTRRSIQGYPVYVSTQDELETGGTDSAYTCSFGDWSQLTHVVWNDIALESTNTGGDSFVKHQTLIKVVWADDWMISHYESFEAYTDLYTA